MGAGLTGGGLTGGPAQATGVTASTGTSAVISSDLGAGATDVVTKAGSSIPNASLQANASIFRVAAGIGGTEVGRADFITAGQATGFKLIGTGTSGAFSINNSAGAQFSWSTTTVTLDASNATLGGSVGNIQRWGAATGLVSVRGTDSSGTPGAATIDKPSGKSAIAAGAASVVITNALVTAASCIHITPETRDATCKELIAVPGVGSFTVSGTAVATATLVFSWHAQNII